MKAVSADVANRGLKRIRLAGRTPLGGARIVLLMDVMAEALGQPTALVLRKPTIEGLLKRVDVSRQNEVVLVITSRAPLFGLPRRTLGLRRTLKLVLARAFPARTTIRAFAALGTIGALRPF